MTENIRLTDSDNLLLSVLYLNLPPEKNTSKEMNRLHVFENF